MTTATDSKGLSTNDCEMKADLGARLSEWGLNGQMWQGLGSGKPPALQALTCVTCTRKVLNETPA